MTLNRCCCSCSVSVATHEKSCFYTRCLVEMCEKLLQKTRLPVRLTRGALGVHVFTGSARERPFLRWRAAATFSAEKVGGETARICSNSHWRAFAGGGHTGERRSPETCGVPQSHRFSERDVHSHLRWENFQTLQKHTFPECTSSAF